VHSREPSETRAEEPAARAMTNLVALWGPEQQLAADKPENDAYYVETAHEVLAADAVSETVTNGKVVKKGKAAVAHQDAKYRKLQ
jgi:hypothetical protein